MKRYLLALLTLTLAASAVAAKVKDGPAGCKAACESARQMGFGMILVSADESIATKILQDKGAFAKQNGFDAPEAHRIVATGWAEPVGWTLDEQLAQAAQHALEDHLVCDTTVAGFEHPACYYSNTGAWGQLFATHGKG